MPYITKIGREISADFCVNAVAPSNYIDVATFNAVAPPNYIDVATFNATDIISVKVFCRASASKASPRRM